MYVSLRTHEIRRDDGFDRREAGSTHMGRHHPSFGLSRRPTLFPSANPQLLFTGFFVVVCPEAYGINRQP
jgi:hypothetical protein